METFLDRPLYPKKSLLPVECETWLLEHIPYRVVGGIALTPIAEEWDLAKTGLSGSGGFRFVCMNYATLQGQRAATRWLIEYIGIQRADGGRPLPSHAAQERRVTDCGIWLLPNGRNMLDSHPDAQFLADTWKGCTQAILHPTVASNHPEVKMAEITRALRAVIDYLQKSIYQGSDLKTVVREYCKRHPAMV